MAGTPHSILIRLLYHIQHIQVELSKFEIFSQLRRTDIALKNAIMNKNFICIYIRK